jgi:hypothetical protein
MASETGRPLSSLTMTSSDPAMRSPAKTKTVSSTNPRDGLISIRHGDVRLHQVVLVLQRIVRGDGILVADLHRRVLHQLIGN